MNPDLSIIVMVWVFLTGLACGSFLNVVILRLPLKGVSIVRPRSHCTVCGGAIKWFDNLPVASFIMLGGRCRHCGTAISFRYPIMELLTAAAFAFAFLRELWIPESASLALDTESWARAATGCALFFSLSAVSMIDLDRRVIPDEFTLPLIPAGIILAAAFPAAFPGPIELSGSARIDAAFNSAAGAATGAAVVFGLGWVFRAILRKEAMGFGDVKLLAMIGAFTALDGAFMTLVIASIAGSIAGSIYYAVKRDRYIPFGPFLAIGGMSAFWFRQEISTFFFQTYPGWLELLFR